ncbi:hypothetical protein C1645_840970 [Glomus cerebriforme]|uniref:Uncharacterized protein n=1 Tax=Glomus cerebriforme TaxID=658196 RepID=A0A397S046_9GLOM|nr:hypothetical protein C1645_840970 [Glomus cerebriforme]
MEQHFALFKNFIFFNEQEKISLAKHTLLLVSNLDLSIARFISSTEPSQNTIMSPKGDTNTNINNTSKIYTNKEFSLDDTLAPLGNLPISDNNNIHNTIMRSSHSRDSSHDKSNITPTKDHGPTPMQDILPLAPIIIPSNNKIDNDSDQSIPVIAIDQPSPSIIPMNTSSTNDLLIKKANKIKKKKSK